MEATDFVAADGTGAVDELLSSGDAGGRGGDPAVVLVVRMHLGGDFVGSGVVGRCRGLQVQGTTLHGGMVVVLRMSVTRLLHRRVSRWAQRSVTVAAA